MRKLLIPLDGSELSEQALSGGPAQFPDETFEITLIRCIDLNDSISYAPDFPAEVPLERERHRSAELSHARYLQEKAELLLADGHRVHTVVVTGNPVDMILRAAEQADLIVMTSNGRSGIKRWFMGSVAETVARRAKVPLLLLPSS
jgi:nucleotide-binding universal stress UspA family protein